MITSIDSFRKGRDGDFTNYNFLGMANNLLDIIIELGKHAEQTELVSEICNAAITMKGKINDETIKGFPVKIRRFCSL